MNGMLTNRRGLRDLAKHLLISDCVWIISFGFVAISEMGRLDFLVSLLSHLSGGLAVCILWMQRLGVHPPFQKKIWWFRLYLDFTFAMW
jgi:hypothetical protein